MATPSATARRVKPKIGHLCARGADCSGQGSRGARAEDRIDRQFLQFFAFGFQEGCQDRHAQFGHNIANSIELPRDSRQIHG
jgi:hypothetical protein